MNDYNIRNRKGYKLDEDQNEIVDFLVNHDAAFNSAQTGFGKTFTTITAALHTYKRYKDNGEDIHFVIICPPAAVKSFTDTLGNIFGIAYNVFTASLRLTKENAKFHIFNFSTLGQNLFDTSLKPTQRTNEYFEILKKLKEQHNNLWLICDEAHALQNPNTTQYKIVECTNRLYIGRWFLTATPILNDIVGLYHMCDLLKPGHLASSVWSFKNKFIEFKDSFFFTKNKFTGKAQKKEIKEPVGYKNLDLLTKLFSEISIIKAKEYDVDFIYRSAQLSPESLKYYRQAAKGLLNGKVDKVDNKGKKKTDKSSQDHAGARLHDLQRVVSNSHPDFQDLDKNQLTEKEVLLFKTVKEALERDEAVLIYFSYIESLERVKYIFSKLKDKLSITNIHQISGSVPLAQRKKVEDAILPRDLVLLTSAGTESVNLQKSNNIIFYEIPFSLREFIQACGRITRTNSKFNKFYVYILEAEGTIDTYKKIKLQSNMTPIKVIIGGKNTLPIEVLQLNAEDKQYLKEALLWAKH